jgi:hypothetical protein
MTKLYGSASRWVFRAAATMAALTLAACGGGGGGSAGEGTLRMSITDQPTCYEHVFITVTKVRVHTNGSAGDNDAGWHEMVLATPKRIDLLNLTNGVLEELGSMPLPAGTYSQVRLVLAETTGQQLDNAVQPIGGQLVQLKTPSAQQSGLKLQVHFTVEENKIIDLVADVDACKSVVRAGNSGQFILRPVVSVTPKFVTAIQGYVSTTMSLNGTSVSAQQNGTIVRSTVPDATGKFVLAYLPEGSYNVVITSDNRATGVVTQVPVSLAASVTTLNGTATAIVLPTSTMTTVSGTVTTGITPVDATVTALQTVSGTGIQVDSTAVDFDLGTYSLLLPVAPPVRAPYSATGLVFAPDAAAAGRYTIAASSPGRTPPPPRTVDIRTAPATANFSF